MISSCSATYSSHFSYQIKKCTTSSTAPYGICNFWITVELLRVCRIILNTKQNVFVLTLICSAKCFCLAQDMCLLILSSYLQILGEVRYLLETGSSFRRRWEGARLFVFWYFVSAVEEENEKLEAWMDRMHDYEDSSSRFTEACHWKDASWSCE